ncbi:MAG TPA: DUF4331 family protein [Caldilineaceae bacterium]|nr:DUF4331 family protein [Caldilineaceae bacterium]
MSTQSTAQRAKPTPPIRQWIVRGALVLAFVLSPLLLATASMVIEPVNVEASSHREAPLISMDQFADNTDTYAFISPTNPDNIVLVASWIPFEGPEGGPNYWQFDPNAHYAIYVDNNGDAAPDHTFVLEATEEIQNPFTFLYNTGPIGADGTNWNRQQRYTLFALDSAGNRTDLLTDVLAPPVNIGSKSTPGYMSLDDTFIYDLPGGGKAFAGQTDDAFWVDLQIFDLLTLRGQAPPIGYSMGNNTPIDSLSGFNNHSLVLEIPIAQLTQGDEPVLGVWAGAARKSMRVLNGLNGVVSGDGLETHSGDYVQVSRLGMPLVNEVVLPYALKDAFNTLKPAQDLTIYTDPTFGPILQKAVEDPEVGRLLCTLYGVPLPGDTNGDCSTEFTEGTPRSGRGDIFDIFLTGMVLASEFTIQTANGPMTLPAGFNVNQPAGVQPAEMIRINTAIKGELCAPTPSRLGVLGGDACGFPNGRRLMDDVIDIELLAVAGAAYNVLDGRDGTFTFDAALIDVLDDGLYGNDVPFQDDFPYMATAQSGQEHIHQNPTGATTATPTSTPDVSPTPTFVPTMPPTTCPTEPGNLLRNGNFEDGQTGWNFYTSSSGAFMVADGDEACDSSAHIRIDDSGDNIQLYQRNIQLEANTHYRLSFSAYSATESDLAVVLHDDDAPYTKYGLRINQVDLDSNQETYTVEFTTRNFTGTVNNARLRFWLAPFAKEGDEYWIDNVSLVKVDGAVSATKMSEVTVTTDGMLIGVGEAEFDRSLLPLMENGNEVAAESQLFLPYVGK